jgi:hypothetical protein
MHIVQETIACWFRAFQNSAMMATNIEMRKATKLVRKKPRNFFFQTEELVL